MTAIFLEGNALNMLKTLPDDFIHVACTSPPYLGLRSYLGGQEIWGGDENCEHEWIDSSTPQSGGIGYYEVGRVGNARARISSHESKLSNTCSLCGAWRGQLGAEPRPDLYIAHLIQIMREVKRVLRPDGVFWINIGDSWAGSNKGLMVDGTAVGGAKQQTMRGSVSGDLFKGFKGDGIKPLDMILIPSMLALAARVDGWYVRSMVIWAKNNPLPESVNGVRWEKHRVKVAKSARASDESYHSTAYGDSPMGARDGRDFSDHALEWRDCPGCEKCYPNDGLILRHGSWRPTDSYEFILMLTKTDHYYCDREAVLEDSVTDINSKAGMTFGSPTGKNNTPELSHAADVGHKWEYSSGRNLRSVWQINTSPYRGAHFAVFPLKVPLTCIKSSVSDKGCCPKCGAPWARVIEKPEVPHDGSTDCKNPDDQGNTRRLALLRQAARERGGEYTNSIKTVTWRPTCSCDAGDPIPCRVLDPFSGAGTTALAAGILGCDSFNIDTSSEYIELAKERLTLEREKRNMATSTKPRNKPSIVSPSPTIPVVGRFTLPRPDKPFPEPSTHQEEDFQQWLSRIKSNSQK